MKTNHINIEKHIPIPTRFPFGELMRTMKKMKVGDSATWHKNISVHANAYVLGIRCCTRREGKTYRFWRIK